MRANNIDQKFKELVFFLGGHDAEMLEIRRLLMELKCDFCDKCLKWGAKVSQYKAELAEIGPKKPVLIELEMDMEIPENAIIIDHHNEKAGKDQPTSIEQIANLLVIKLDRWQKLIAANDRGWIPAMEAAGATREEIDQIRRYDRACQGATEEMERQAEQVCSYIQRTNKPVVVHFGFDLISPVTDRLYGVAENILVIGPKSTTFSGDGRIVRRLAEKYTNDFFGGDLPEQGFWGLPYQEKRVEQLIIKHWEELNDKKGFSEI